MESKRQLKKGKTMERVENNAEQDHPVLVLANMLLNGVHGDSELNTEQYNAFMEFVKSVYGDELLKQIAERVDAVDGMYFLPY